MRPSKTKWTRGEIVTSLLCEANDIKQELAQMRKTGYVPGQYMSQQEYDVDMRTMQDYVLSLEDIAMQIKLGRILIGCRVKAEA